MSTLSVVESSQVLNDYQNAAHARSTCTRKLFPSLTHMRMRMRIHYKEKCGRRESEGRQAKQGKGAGSKITARKVRDFDHRDRPQVQ